MIMQSQLSEVAIVLTQVANEILHKDISVQDMSRGLYYLAAKYRNERGNNPDLENEEHTPGSSPHNIGETFKGEYV